MHGWHVVCCTLRRILHKVCIPTVGALERAVTWHGYVAHAQVRGVGTVAFVSEAGALELDGNTIVNTESTTVRIVARLGAIEVAVVTRAVAEKRVRIGADRHRRAGRGDSSGPCSRTRRCAERTTLLLLGRSPH